MKTILRFLYYLSQSGRKITKQLATNAKEKCGEKGMIIHCFCDYKLIQTPRKSMCKISKRQK